MNYTEDVEQQMKRFYETLSEKDKRAYAAVEVAKLGHGGTEYIAQVLGCDPKTIRQGRRDLSQGLELAPGKVRRAGGGRKKIRALQSDLDEAFKEILQEETAGEPMHGSRWTHLTKQQIADRLAQAGFKVSRNIVKQLLKAHGYVKRKAQKAQAMGQNPARNAQFENIAEIKQQYLDSANPILSMDTKKKNGWVASTVRANSTPEK
jgi:hypothetical protein